MIMQEYLNKTNTLNFKDWYRACVNREKIRINMEIMKSQRFNRLKKVIRFFKENF
jgi:hypothetical protein